jgi:hypothetical protein
MALHAAIAWSACVASGRAEWLAVGMLYAMGKYVFIAATHEPDIGAAAGRAVAPEPRPSFAAAAVRLAGHADVRWHLWIALAALGHLEWALAAYAAYFPVRAALVAARKAVRRG